VDGCKLKAARCGWDLCPDASGARKPEGLVPEGDWEPQEPNGLVSAGGGGTRESNGLVPAGDRGTRESNGLVPAGDRVGWNTAGLAPRGTDWSAASGQTFPGSKRSRHLLGPGATQRQSSRRQSRREGLLAGTATRPGNRSAGTSHTPYRAVEHRSKARIGRGGYLDSAHPGAQVQSRHTARDTSHSRRVRVFEDRNAEPMIPSARRGGSGCRTS